jgi:hypothetical protein
MRVLSFQYVLSFLYTGESTQFSDALSPSVREHAPTNFLLAAIIYALLFVLALFQLILNIRKSRGGLEWDGSNIAMVNLKGGSGAMGLSGKSSSKASGRASAAGSAREERNNSSSGLLSAAHTPLSHVVVGSAGSAMNSASITHPGTGFVSPVASVKRRSLDQSNVPGTGGL